jgi:hypothetical protein
MKEAIHIEIDRVLVEGLNETEQAHVSGCYACSKALESGRADIAELRQIDESLAQVPQSFWDAQRRAIRVRAAEVRPKSVFTGAYAWAGAAVAALIVAASLLMPNAPEQTLRHPTQQQEEISDAALIQSVQEQLEGYPEALHPAQVMYTEMASAKSTPRARK